MKQLLITGLLILLVSVSCKKDHPLATKKASPPPPPGPASYNITHKVFNPSISTRNFNDSIYMDSVVVALDSTNTYSIMLQTMIRSSSCFSNNVHLYDDFASVVSKNNAVLLASGTFTSFISPVTHTNYSNILINDWINDSLSWRSSVSLEASSSCAGGFGFSLWQYPNDGYVAIKIVTSSGNKYGWIKLNLANGTYTAPSPLYPSFSFPKLVMTEYAINNNYGQFIHVGQTH